MSNNLLSNGNDMAQITRDYLEWTNSHGITERAVEIWVQLYEKAWAEVKGSYNNVGNGGHCDDVWKALTGKNGTRTSVSGNTHAEILQIIDNAINAGKIVCLGTETPQNSLGIAIPIGFAAPHAYYLTGNSITNYIMKNPWGDQITINPAGGQPIHASRDIQLSSLVNNNGTTDLSLFISTVYIFDPPY
jgi:hypothetical protein